MDDQQEAIRVRVPNKVIPPDQVRGVYANQIVQLSTELETIIDFSLVVPSHYEQAQSGAFHNIEVAHELVARIIVPRAQFNEFIRSVLASQIEVQGGTEEIIQGSENGDG